MKKRFCSLILVMVMLCTLLPQITLVVGAVGSYDAQTVVDLALQYVSGGYDEDSCLRFVAELFSDAYGIYASGYTCCAHHNGDSYIDSSSRENIPLGACVYFGGHAYNADPIWCYEVYPVIAGHIGVYVGNNQIVHAWAGQIVCTTIDHVINCGYSYRGCGWYADQPLSSESIPVTAYDVAKGGINSVQVVGWAYDPDTPSDSLQIHVYMDGVCIGTGVANTLREDVNAVYGCGSNHGFDITIPVTVAETGNHSIEVYALNTNTSGGNAYLGSKEVTITAHTHSYAIAIIKEATCTQEGLKSYTCQSCTDTYTEQTPAIGHNYISEMIGATCTTVGHTAFTCDRCGDRYVEMSDGWSEWSTEYPTGVPENLIEEKTQYSTLEKEYTASTYNTLEGWTYCGTTYGDWDAVHTTTTKPTESDTLRITDTTQTDWGYYHWCNYYYNGGNNWNVDSIEYGSPCYWHGYTSNFELPAISFQDQGGQQAYGGTGSGAVHCDYNFYIWFRNTGADVYTYSYQTRSAINQFYKWSDKWSDWSDEEATGNEDCQVKTRIVYRQYIGELADHSYSYAVTESPTSDTMGSLRGTCTNCSDAMLVSLPVLDTTEYSYSIIAEPSGMQAGIGRYTWKTSDYGTIYFEVEIAPTQLRGDFDQDDSVTDADALYLLRYTLFPNRYPISQNGDVDGDGTVTDADALYLLRYTLFPERYPLKP